MKTAEIKGVVFVATLAFLHDLVRGDTEVTCVLMESCILPCKFHAGKETVIHWIHLTAGDSSVHSFYYDKDQFQRQDRRFRNRTSLFKEQISRGNASLRLTKVETEDQGKYKCHTSIPDEPEQATVINLKVEDAAPVTPKSVLLSSTQISFVTQPSGGSDNKFKGNIKKIIIGVVSGLVLSVIGGLTVCYLYQNVRCCGNTPNQQAEAQRGGEHQAAEAESCL